LAQKMTLLITTSREPTRRIRTLSHDLNRVIPGSQQINRGKLNHEGVIEEALALGLDRAMFLERWKGAPGKIELHLLRPNDRVYYPVIYLSSVTLQAEIRGNASIRAGLTASITTRDLLQLNHLAEALASFLQIPLRINDDSSLSPSPAFPPLPPRLFFESRGSRITVTFKNKHDAEIGPRLEIKKVAWSDRSLLT
jgi:rRNA maturation protein Rpf1